MPQAAAEYLVEILDRYAAVRRDGVDGPFRRSHPLWRAFDGFAESVRGLDSVRGRTELNVKWSAGQGNWARVPWTALMYPGETESTQRGVYAVFLFREDMSGVYVTWNQGVTDLQKQHGTREARKVLRERANRLSAFLPDERRGFRTGDGIDLRTEGSLAVTYEHSTIAFKLYERDALPTDEELDADLEVVLQAYDRYMESELRGRLPGAAPASPAPVETGPPETAPPASSAFDRAQATEELLRYIEQRGYVYEPWQVAQYLTAVRTKPFVILAGITGTGKSKLPRLVSDGTGGATDLVPVRPDWTDASEVLGYADLEGVFRPGAVLEIANTAMAEDDVHHTVIVDEMNLARVEHYFAEVLSRIEDRRATENGGFQSSPLVRTDLRAEDAEWGQVRLPPNLALVGTVNMDESAHGFSRKVLDRAFTIELSDVDLRAGIEASPSSSSNSPSVWPVKSWFPRGTRLATGGQVSKPALSAGNRSFHNHPSGTCACCVSRQSHCRYEVDVALDWKAAFAPKVDQLRHADIPQFREAQSQIA